MQELMDAHVNVVVLSWWGPKHNPATSDTQARAPLVCIWLRCAAVDVRPVIIGATACARRCARVLFESQQSQGWAYW